MESESFYNTPYRTRNSGSFDIGVRQLSLGIGFPNTLYENQSFLNHTADTRTSGFGPLMFKYELGISDEIGLGIVGEFAAKTWRYHTGDEFTDKAYGLGISLLGYYHFNKFIPIRQLDVYAGTGVNVNHSSLKRNYFPSEKEVNVSLAGVVGARYHFTDQFGFYGEFGRTSFSWVNLGFTLRYQ